MYTLILENFRNLKLLLSDFDLKAIDLANFPIPLNIHHSKVLDLSFPIWIESFAMLQPYPEEQSRLVAPIRPYTNTV